MPLTDSCWSVAVKPMLCSITPPKWGCDRANSKDPSTSFSWNTLAKWPSPKEVKKSQHSSKLNFLSCFPWTGSLEDEAKLGLEMRLSCFPEMGYKRNHKYWTFIAETCYIPSGLILVARAKTNTNFTWVCNKATLDDILVSRVFWNISAVLLSASMLCRCCNNTIMLCQIFHLQR